MATARRERFIHGTLAWTLASALVLTLFDVLTYDLFFVFAFVGFLVVTELTAPFSVTPAWRSRLRWLVALGLVAFAALVARRVLSLVPSEVLPDVLSGLSSIVVPGVV